MNSNENLNIDVRVFITVSGNNPADKCRPVKYNPEKNRAAADRKYASKGKKHCGKNSYCKGNGNNYRSNVRTHKYSSNQSYIPYTLFLAKSENNGKGKCI